MTVTQIVVLILASYSVVLFVVNRICSCIEHCAGAKYVSKAYADCTNKTDVTKNE